MKARVIKSFRDKKQDVARKKGDVFILSRQRYEEINATRFGRLVEEVKDKPDSTCKGG